MKMFIPQIGDSIKLINDLNLILSTKMSADYCEFLSTYTGKKLTITLQNENHKNYDVLIPIGTVLKVNKFQIKNTIHLYDSYNYVQFIIESCSNKNLIKKKICIDLNQVNKIEFEIANLITEVPIFELSNTLTKVENKNYRKCTDFIILGKTKDVVENKKDKNIFYKKITDENVNILDCNFKIEIYKSYNKKYKASKWKISKGYPVEVKIENSACQNNYNHFTYILKYKNKKISDFSDYTKLKREIHTKCTELTGKNVIIR